MHQTSRHFLATHLPHSSPLLVRCTRLIPSAPRSPPSMMALPVLQILTPTPPFSMLPPTITSQQQTSGRAEPREDQIANEAACSRAEECVSVLVVCSLGSAVPGALEVSVVVSVVVAGSRVGVPMFATAVASARGVAF